MDKKHECINNRQLNILIVLYTIGSSILLIPSLLTSAAKQDAWISACIGTIMALGVMWWFTKVSQLYPKKDFIELFELAFGKWFGKLLGLVFLILPIVLSVLLLWNIGDFVVTQILPETPIQAIFLMFTFVVIYGIRLGIETLVRTAEIFFPWIIGLASITLLLLMPEIELKNILPIFEGGIQPILAGSYQLIGFPFLEMVVFLMILPRRNNHKSTKKILFAGIIIGGLILTLFTLMCILVFGAELTSRNTFPAYILGKKISIGRFLERIEIIIAIIWFLSIYFKLAINFYVVNIGIMRIFSLTDYRSLTFPLGMLIVVLTLIMIPNSTFVIEFNEKVWTSFTATFAILIPFIVYLRLKIKKRMAALKNRS